MDRFRVKGVPGQEKTMKEIAWAAYNNVPEGMEMGLEAENYYEPPNFTFPFGAYVCVLRITSYNVCYTKLLRAACRHGHLAG